MLRRSPQIAGRSIASFLAMSTSLRPGKFIAGNAKARLVYPAGLLRGLLLNH